MWFSGITSRRTDFAIPQPVIMSSPTGASLLTAGAAAAGVKVKGASVVLALAKHHCLFEEMDNKIELLTTENTLLRQELDAMKWTIANHTKKMTLMDGKIEELQTEQAELKESRLNRVASREASGSDDDDETSDGETEMMRKERSAIEASLVAYVDTSFKVSICISWALTWHQIITFIRSWRVMSGEGCAPSGDAGGCH
jgi:hypothetical protein